jgi:signal transduction histidine kinase/ActR/RegA family two-component response regulator
MIDAADGSAPRHARQLPPLMFYAVMFPLMHFGFAKAELLSPSLAPIRETLVLVFLVLLSALAYVYQRLLEAENQRLEVKRIEVANALNQQLMRTQKMDAMGQLTGGIAHDFNNILAIILGNLELLELEVGADDKAAEFLRLIQKASQRAAELTQKLLVFAGNRPVKLSVTDINRLIAEMEGLIGRSLTPAVNIEHHFAENLWLTEINSGDLGDALINLVVNAHDAMPGGGTLTLATHNRILDDDYCAQNPGVVPGEYVELAVSDTGEGLSPEQQQHIFEPFYTTKDTGTGLGLAMVYGFTKRSGGHVNVSSEIGVGTTIRIYLPRAVSQDQGQHSGDGEAEALPRGSKTVLVVDDEAALLDLAKTQLQSLGYRVLVAGDGWQALTVLADDSRIDLLFSDIVMPGGMNGYELAEQATAIRPGLKVLLVSGYEQQTRDQSGQTRVTDNRLTKPYTLTELAKRVRDVMDDVSQDG